MESVGDAVAWLTERARELPPGALAAAALVVLALVVALLRRARRPRRRRPRPGELWFALVPYEDRPGAKDRPVLVLEVDGDAVVVAQLTSQDKSRRRDHVSAPARLTGMRKDSWLELRRRTLRRRAFRRRAGDLGQAGLVWFERELERAGRDDAPVDWR